MKKAIPLVFLLFLGYWIATDSSGFLTVLQTGSVWSVDAIGTAFAKIIDIVEAL